MRPFFRWFGSKWQVAKHYGSPRSSIVIEPFAGSAGYSVYWNCPSVQLYDVDEQICLLWDWLINSSVQDVKDLPDYIDSNEQIYEYPPAITQLIGRWLKYSIDGGLPKNSALSMYKRYVAYWRDNIHNEFHKHGACIFWSPAIKNRIIRQKPLISKWTIEQCSYEKIPNKDAHWFIDPPYQNPSVGKRYRYGSSRIDYSFLSTWVKARSSAVDVCEQAGAAWLPFTPLRTTVNQKRKHYTELVWRKDNIDLLDGFL